MVSFTYECSRLPEFLPRFASVISSNGSVWTMSTARTTRETYLPAGDQKMLELAIQIRKARYGINAKDKTFETRGYYVGFRVGDFACACLRVFLSAGVFYCLGLLPIYDLEWLTGCRCVD